MKDELKRLRDNIEDTVGISREMLLIEVKKTIEMASQIVDTEGGTKKEMDSNVKLAAVKRICDMQGYDQNITRIGNPKGEDLEINTNVIILPSNGRD